MKPIYFTQTKVDPEPGPLLDRSKFLGAPAFPEGFMDRNELGDTDYFIAQVNLEEVGEQDLLPSHGYLYFFLDVLTLEPKVFFEQGEPAEVVSDFNEAFDPDEFGPIEAYHFVFGVDKGHFLFGDPDPDLDLGMYLENPEDYVTLLQIDSLSLPDGEALFQIGSLAPYDGYYIFLIKREDLEKLDFTKVRYIDYGS